MEFPIFLKPESQRNTKRKIFFSRFAFEKSFSCPNPPILEHPVSLFNRTCEEKPCKSQVHPHSAGVHT